MDPIQKTVVRNGLIADAIIGALHGYAFYVNKKIESQHNALRNTMSMNDRLMTQL